jgi:hypothetical protein
MLILHIANNNVLNVEVRLFSIYLTLEFGKRTKLGALRNGPEVQI